jgi:hypothetical protein
MELSETQKKIIEIKKKIADNFTGMFSTHIYGKDNLLAELDTLETKERFQLNQEQLKISKKQARISLWVGVGSVSIGIIAVITSLII